MDRELVPELICPARCGGSLALLRDDCLPDVQSGVLQCDACGAEHEVDHGIPRLLSAELLEGQAAGQSEIKKRAEMLARDEQAGRYDRMWHLNLFGLVEIPAMVRYLELAPHHTLLEGGCGTGRMTPRFARLCNRMYALDFSFASLISCKAKLARAGIRNVSLMQADVCSIPLRNDSFDRVVSCQVLEHVPTPESRLAAIAEMKRVLKERGVLALSAYKYSLPIRIFGKKEGEHRGGIHYYRFSKSELKTLLSQELEVRRMTGALVYHYIAQCEKTAKEPPSSA